MLQIYACKYACSAISHFTFQIYMIVKYIRWFEGK